MDISLDWLQYFGVLFGKNIQYVSPLHGDGFEKTFRHLQHVGK